jgi:hypothetical protein
MPMDRGARFWGWAPELDDVIAVSPHTKRVMASGEALVIALVSGKE